MIEIIIKFTKIESKNLHNSAWIMYYSQSLFGNSKNNFIFVMAIKIMGVKIIKKPVEIPLVLVMQ
ncbi:MAG: hypothetical protein CVU13_10825 [Bacteroidetes bacterium HGW-Bacteroidetes-8]|nr:MAG: hypothetical protein CVU13_10825 [Bacteroidetes bacterium HGW-Bacteroidetes-8]